MVELLQMTTKLSSHVSPKFHPTKIFIQFAASKRLSSPIDIKVAFRMLLRKIFFIYFWRLRSDDENLYVQFVNLW